MVVSFDLDNTLIPYSNEFDVEYKSFFVKALNAEPLRKGTKDLFENLENDGHQIWIYTTSFRSIFKIKKTFLSYGLFPVKIINGAINQKQLRKHKCTASKNPKLFNIDIHVDDLEGVGLEGIQLDFKTIIVDVNDKNWVAKVKNSIDGLNSI